MQSGRIEASMRKPRRPPPSSTPCLRYSPPSARFSSLDSLHSLFALSLPIVPHHKCLLTANRTAEALFLLPPRVLCRLGEPRHPPLYQPPSTSDLPSWFNPTRLSTPCAPPLATFLFSPSAPFPPPLLCPFACSSTFPISNNTSPVQWPQWIKHPCLVRHRPLSLPASQSLRPQLQHTIPNQVQLVSAHISLPHPLPARQRLCRPAHRTLYQTTRTPHQPQSSLPAR